MGGGGVGDGGSGMEWISWVFRGEGRGARSLRGVKERGSWYIGGFVGGRGGRGGGGKERK